MMESAPDKHRTPRAPEEDTNSIQDTDPNKDPKHGGRPAPARSMFTDLPSAFKHVTHRQHDVHADKTKEPMSLSSSPSNASETVDVSVYRNRFNAILNPDSPDCDQDVEPTEASNVSNSPSLTYLKGERVNRGKGAVDEFRYHIKSTSSSQPLLQVPESGIRPVSYAASHESSSSGVRTGYGSTIGDIIDCYDDKSEAHGNNHIVPSGSIYAKEPGPAPRSNLPALPEKIARQTLPNLVPEESSASMSLETKDLLSKEIQRYPVPHESRSLTSEDIDKILEVQRAENRLRYYNRQSTGHTSIFCLDGNELDYRKGAENHEAGRSNDTAFHHASRLASSLEDPFTIGFDELASDDANEWEDVDEPTKLIRRSTKSPKKGGRGTLSKNNSPKSLKSFKSPKNAKSPKSPQPAKYHPANSQYKHKWQSNSTAPILVPSYEYPECSKFPNRNASTTVPLAKRVNSQYKHPEPMASHANPFRVSGPRMRPQIYSPPIPKFGMTLPRAGDPASTSTAALLKDSQPDPVSTFAKLTKSGSASSFWEDGGFPSPQSRRSSSRSSKSSLRVSVGSLKRATAKALTPTKRRVCDLVDKLGRNGRRRSMSPSSMEGLNVTFHSDRPFYNDAGSSIVGDDSLSQDGFDEPAVETPIRGQEEDASSTYSDEIRDQLTPLREILAYPSHTRSIMEAPSEMTPPPPLIQLWSPMRSETPPVIGSRLSTVEESVEEEGNQGSSSISHASFQSPAAEGQSSPLSERTLRRLKVNEEFNKQMIANGVLERASEEASRQNEEYRISCQRAARILEYQRQGDVTGVLWETRPTCDGPGIELQHVSRDPESQRAYILPPSHPPFIPPPSRLRQRIANRLSNEPLKLSQQVFWALLAPSICTFGLPYFFMAFDGFDWIVRNLKDNKIWGIDRQYKRYAKGVGCLILAVWIVGLGAPILYICLMNRVH